MSRRLLFVCPKKGILLMLNLIPTTPRGSITREGSVKLRRPLFALMILQCALRHCCANREIANRFIPEEKGIIKRGL